MINRTFISLFGACIAGLGLTAFNPRPELDNNVGGNFVPTKPECIAPATPGGGYDLTCRLAAKTLERIGSIDRPMLVKYMPGGMGAVAYNHAIENENDDPNIIVAASSASAFNIARGKFGKENEDAVRWLAAVGADYGVIAVRADAPWQNLNDLIRDLKKDPKSVTFSTGGCVGGQDWMKVVLLARAAGIDYKQMSFVPFEGGGEAIASLMGAHVEVYSGDASEVDSHLDNGKFRLLAVLADERLSGVFAKYPTAKEQGYDVTWPVWRGYYLPPDITEEQYQWWVNTMKKLVNSPEYKQEIAERGLFPFAKVGKEYDVFVKKQVQEFRQQAKNAGITL